MANMILTSWEDTLRANALLQSRRRARTSIESDGGSWILHAPRVGRAYLARLRRELDRDNAAHH